MFGGGASESSGGSGDDALRIRAVDSVFFSKRAERDEVVQTPFEALRVLTEFAREFVEFPLAARCRGEPNQFAGRGVAGQKEPTGGVGQSRFPNAFFVRERSHLVVVLGGAEGPIAGVCVDRHCSCSAPTVFNITLLARRQVSGFDSHETLHEMSERAASRR
ncbi:hypothetical protein [Haladaptatus halobius]|uniref:hypothetical protein n=1 Tax=Haladaptatus halobius TaxID=2884875 RepID=UPI001D09CA8A|nr:hypothetical protein [Haladaptatus halobius]